MLKRILSYIFPLTLLSKPSKISRQLSVTLLNGKYLLNTPIPITPLVAYSVYCALALSK